MVGAGTGKATVVNCRTLTFFVVVVDVFFVDGSSLESWWTMYSYLFLILFYMFCWLLCRCLNSCDVQAAKDVGIPTLPPSLTVELANDSSFIQALYHILMNVHLIKGMLTCPVTGKEFPVIDGIPNLILEEEECEKVRL
jgi:uncharacterized protein YbaR (Trm112 family)